MAGLLGVYHAQALFVCVTMGVYHTHFVCVTTHRPHHATFAVPATRARLRARHDAGGIAAAPGRVSSAALRGGLEDLVGLHAHPNEGRASRHLLQRGGADVCAAAAQPAQDRLDRLRHGPAVCHAASRHATRHTAACVHGTSTCLPSDARYSATELRSTRARGRTRTPPSLHAHATTAQTTRGRLTQRA